MIEFKNVSKIYPNGAYALKNVNISINKGEFVFIVGHSGAGKSTFLKMILREEVPTEGTVIVNDINVCEMKHKQIPYLRRNLGIVFQDFRLIPSKTVYENVAFSLRVTDSSSRSIKKRVPYILNLVGLSKKAKCYPSELSGGEQQRVALARALVNNPAIIIADEPTGNIDPELSFEILELLQEINKVGTTVIIVTHETDLVEHFKQRLIKIDKGEVVSDTGSIFVEQNNIKSSYIPDDNIKFDTGNIDLNKNESINDIIDKFSKTNELKLDLASNDQEKLKNKKEFLKKVDNKYDFEIDKTDFIDDIFIEREDK